MILQLHPLEFVELSLTCRYTHWKMFTFATCYCPYTVRMEIIDSQVKPGIEKYKIAPKVVFYTGQQRGFFVLQPTCLKQPFFFETLELSLQVPKRFFHTQISNFKWILTRIQ